MEIITRKITVDETKPPKKLELKNGKLHFGCSIWPIDRAYLALDKMVNRQHSYTCVLDGVVFLGSRRGIIYNDKLIKWDDAEYILSILKPHYRHRFYEERSPS